MVYLPFFSSCSVLNKQEYKMKSIMWSPDFKKVLLVAVPPPEHAAQTYMHVHELHSLTNACQPHPKPVSLTLGGTLSRQASKPCQRQNFASRAPPSSHGPGPQTDDSYTHGSDPTGRYTHALTNFLQSVCFLFTTCSWHPWPPRQGWMTEQITGDVSYLKVIKMNRKRCTTTTNR